MVGASAPPAEPAPPWVAVASSEDIRAGYAWTAAALISGAGGRIGAREANALAVLLAGAARTVDPPGPPSLDAVPGLTVILDAAREVLEKHGGKPAVADFRALVAERLGQKPRAAE